MCTVHTGYVHTLLLSWSPACLEPGLTGVELVGVGLACLCSGPPGFNCWISVAPTFQC